MIGIVTGTIGVALSGGPSTIALAHFAACTQGLQLLDARPRRTEFLLVVLALFQVVLAANLTDSVFFTPLLVLFVLATVWTLVVHTLRSEALEAGQAAELSGAFTPGLLRTTLWASALSVVLAMLLFVALPRLRSSVVQGPMGAASLATAGFSDRVEFGALGRIRQDPRVVLRVETLEGEPPARNEAYYRGLAFDHFDGRSWSITPPDRVRVPGTAEGGVTLGREPRAIRPGATHRARARRGRGAVPGGRPSRRPGHDPAARTRRLRRPLRGAAERVTRPLHGALLARTCRTTRPCDATAPSRRAVVARPWAPCPRSPRRSAPSPAASSRVPPRTPIEPARSSAGWCPKAATPTSRRRSQADRIDDPPLPRRNASCWESWPVIASTSRRAWCCSRARSDSPLAS